MGHRPEKTQPSPMPRSCCSSLRPFAENSTADGIVLDGWAIWICVKQVGPPPPPGWFGFLVSPVTIAASGSLQKQIITSLPCGCESQLQSSASPLVVLKPFGCQRGGSWACPGSDAYGNVAGKEQLTPFKVDARVEHDVSPTKAKSSHLRTASQFEPSVSVPYFLWETRLSSLRLDHQSDVVSLLVSLSNHPKCVKQDTPF